MRISDWSSDVCSSDLKIVQTMKQAARAIVLMTSAALRDLASGDLGAVIDYASQDRKEPVRFISKCRGVGCQTIKQAWNRNGQQALIRINRQEDESERNPTLILRDRKSTRLNSSH